MSSRNSIDHVLEVKVRQLSGALGLGVGASGEFSPPSPASPQGRRSHDAAGQQEVTLELGAPEGDLERIDSIPEEQRIDIEIDNLSAWVPSLFGQPSLLQRLRPSNLKRRVTEGGSLRTPKMNQILYNVSGCVRPGEVLALMGPSGSGKTTLLSIMGGRAQRSMQVTGTVLFNGSRLNKSMKRTIGYVMQDDLLYESLTVSETLYYAAMLRLPREMTREEKLRRVDSVIAALGLERCKDTIVGGFFRRGISGGERKRASVGHELLINPKTMFLDEPTSGLDSTSALHLMRTLRSLAEGGRAIVTTIHQPSSRLYQQLDKLLLLSQGHVMFYGHAQQAVDYFEELGYPIPPRVNAADFILDLASGEVSSGQRRGEASRQHLITCAETFLADNPQDGFDLTRDAAALSSLGAVSFAVGRKGSSDDTGSTGSGDGTGTGTGTTKGPQQYKAATWTGKSTRSMTEVNLRAPSSKLSRSVTWGGKKDDRWGASYLTQIGILFQRSLRTRRFETLSTQDFCQLIIIAVLAGLFWLQKGTEQTLYASRDILGVLFFMLMFLSFRSLFVSLFTFPAEQRHMLKERASGLYRLSAFYIARMLSDFPADASIPTVFIIIVYFMAGLRYSAAAFFGIYGTLLLSMFVAQSLGLLLGSYFMNPKTAQTVAAVLMLTIVLTGGFFVQNIPSWIAWLRYVSYIYYALGILLYIQYDGGNSVVYSCTSVDSSNQCVQTAPADPASDPTCVPVDDLQQSLNLLQDPSSSTQALYGGMILLAFFIVIRVAMYFVLRRKTAGF